MAWSWRSSAQSSARNGPSLRARSLAFVSSPSPGARGATTWAFSRARSTGKNLVLEKQARRTTTT
eukprot:7937865-Lingulodinium_polyedra.AAC.1